MSFQDQSERKISLYKRIVFLAAGVVFALVVLELSLRLGGFIMFSVQELKNRQALRQHGTYRILCVGESTTQNQYPSFLAAILNQSGSGITFSVIDKGLSGTNSSAILAGMESYLDTYRPHMVVAMMGHNDATVIYYKDIPDANSALFKNCKAYRLIRLAYCRILEKMSKEKGPGMPAEPAIQGNDGISQKEKLFRQRIVANPKEGRNYSGLGWLYANMGKLSLAKETFEQGISVDPKDSRCYGGLGRILVLQGKDDLAESSFKQAIAADPRNARYYAVLGRFYIHQKKYDLSEKVFKQGIAVNPGNSACYGDLGRLYLLNGKAGLAEQTFKQGILADPKDYTCYVGLGGVYENQNRLSLAEGYFLKGIQLNPGDHRIYGSLALLYQEKGRDDLAQKYYRKVNELCFNNQSAITAWNYLRLREMLKRRGIRLVCVQYPMRSIRPLRDIFKDDDEGVIFVSNEEVFKNAVKREGYNAYFWDMFAGDFGHCNEKGNKLLAGTIARVILREVAHK